MPGRLAMALTRAPWTFGPFSARMSIAAGYLESPIGTLCTQAIGACDLSEGTAGHRVVMVINAGRTKLQRHPERTHRDGGSGVSREGL